MRNLSVEELKKYPYPNLVAEIIESHYSICTIGDHMGLGQYCEEDDPEVWGRLAGEKEILFGEVVGLAQLFGASPEYLFSHELYTIDKETYAHYRWLEDNKRRDRESMEFDIRQNIDRALREKPFLLGIVSMITSMSEKEATAIMMSLSARMKGGAA